MYYLVHGSGAGFRFKTDLSLYYAENRLDFFEHVYDSASNKFIEKDRVSFNCYGRVSITVSNKAITIGISDRASELKEKLIEAGIEVKDT